MNSSTDEAGKKINKMSQQELAAKLDADLDEFINGLEKKAYTEGWPEDRWQEEMEKHPFFMTKAPEPGEQLSPLMEGIQQLKYDENENTPEELAKSYKEDGNFNFKCKKYRFAIIAYTEGLRRKCNDNDLNAQLYNNRAASNYFLQNYRSCLNDCAAALRLKPDYTKAITRASQCCYHLRLYEDCIKYCEQILSTNADDKEAKSLLAEAINAKKVTDRDMRKQNIETKREDKKDMELLEVVRSRKIIFQGREKTPVELSDLEPQSTNTICSRVYLQEDGRLVWPVILLYPEYKLTDFIQSFHEDVTFEEIFSDVFAELPEWDHERKYTPHSVRVYFGDEEGHVYNIPNSFSLGEALSHEKFVLRGGTPGFMILVAGSAAENFVLALAT